jgi:voltage-gated potassium channel
MNSTDNPNPLLVRPNYELFLFLLTILSVGNIILSLFLGNPARQVIAIIDNCICVIFLLDFFFRIASTRPVRYYLIDWYGWMDFVGSLPLPGIRLVRLLRYGLIGRRFRRADMRVLQHKTLKKRAQTTLLGVILVAILILEISGILILHVESASSNANILTASDALWWNLVTIATVGYGDRFPVTNPGRIVAIFVMTVGVGVFSVFTSYLADWFRRGREENGHIKNEVARKPSNLDHDLSMNKQNVSDDGINSQVDEIERLIEAMEQEHKESLKKIRTKLAEIEKRTQSNH